MSLDKYDIENVSEITYSVLLLAEGKADVSFLMHLLSQRQIGGLHFGFPIDATGGFGVTGMGKYLSRLPARTGFNKLKSVLVLYDNDSDAAAAFAAVRALIDPADPYSVPATPLALADADGSKVRLMFVPMPGIGANGALETLMLQSAVATSAEALACIDALTACAHCDGWPPSPAAKMRLRCLISVKCQGNSDTTLTNIWNKPGNPIDLTHACFDGFVHVVTDVLATV